jgi:hypothetical protein
VIGVTFVFVVVTATHLRCRFLSLPAATGVVPEANGAAGVPKVSSFAMILPTTFTVSVAVVQFDGLTLTLWSYRLTDGIGNRVRSRWGIR